MNKTDICQYVEPQQPCDGWTINGNKLVRAFKFRNFVEAFGFMAKVALLAQEMDHHPDWSNSYNRVTIELTTHDTGSLTEKDYALAEKINAVI